MGIEKSIEAGKKNFAIANERRRLIAESKRLAKQERIDSKKKEVLIRRFIKAAKRYAKHQEKLHLANQHGIAVGDYARCKRLNGTACEPCRAVAAKYVSDKWKTDPKYKAKEKEYFKNNPHKRPPKSRDRARHRGAERKYYTRQQIFDRDGYNCYLCNEPIDLTASHNMGQPGWELYPHIEHVIPLALGGSDTLDNVKIAHAKCNIAKGVNLPSTTAPLTQQ